MERIVRTVLIAGGMLFLFLFVIPKLTGKSHDTHAVSLEGPMINAPDFQRDVVDPSVDGKANVRPDEGALCTIRGEGFDAELSSRGAALTHLYLSAPQFQGTEARDVSSTPDHERWRSLRTRFRGPDADSQVAYDRFNWKLDVISDTTCKFTYLDEGKVEIVKTVSRGLRPFEISIVTLVKNLSSEKKRHRYAIEDFAFRRNSELKSGFFGRQSPFVTEVSCAGGKDVQRKSRDDFKDGPFVLGSADRYAAVSNTYFAEALVPSEPVACRIVAEEWPGKTEDSSGAVYQARLEHAPRELAPNEVATYETTAFFGPKDRRVLGQAGGPKKKLSDLINLGFFSPVARVLVSVLVFFQDKVSGGNWGVAIILMTIALKVALFPLTFISLKNTIAMRRFKPELDAMLAKFEGDAQAKQLATMQFYKEKKFNPFGGCLPMMVQMPVWFAMFTTLQTAVELYHIKFLWIQDLTAPDPYFAIPLVLGACMIIQQRITPMTGVDPVQAKVMTYLMPLIFTATMLFLPAALAIYSLSNSLIGIIQQLALEAVAPRAPAEITVKDVSPGRAG